MNTIEKIRAEIERLIEMNKTKNGFPAGTICAVRIEAYEHLLSFISTLSEEPDKSLEEEVKRYYSDNFAYISSDQPTLSILTNIARHFAEWQREQMMDEWLKDRDGCFWDGVEEGKKAMKEQMLKDAVEGYVGMHLTDKGTKVTVNSGYLPEEMGIRSDSKVRIIIVKED